MKLYSFDLTPRGAIHHPPTSDTLFGALCWALLALKGNNQNWLRNYLDQCSGPNKPLLLSSAFPVLQCNPEIPCFPLPRLPEPTAADLIGERFDAASYKQRRLRTALNLKKVGKARWVSESILLEMAKGATLTEVYRRLLAGVNTDHDRPVDSDLPEPYMIVDGFLLKESEARLMLSATDRRQPLIDRVRARNRLDRLTLCTGEGELFFQREIFLRKDGRGRCGITLRGYLRTDDPDLIDAALRWLEDTGIGGDRTVGMGNYRISRRREYDGEVLTQVGPSSSFMTLARYLPGADDGLSAIGYELLPYRGSAEAARFAEHTWKDRVLYFAEGSVFGVRTPQPFYGRLADVITLPTGDRIRQYGLAFPVYGNFRS